MMSNDRAKREFLFASQSIELIVFRSIFELNDHDDGDEANFISAQTETKAFAISSS